jgi:intergrase/recombinase
LNLYRGGIRQKEHNRSVLAPPKGLEPLTDWLTATHGSKSPYSVVITDAMLENFARFCRIDLVRSAKCIKMHLNAMRRYVREMGNTIDANRIRDFLFKIRSNYPNPRTYRWYLCALKIFCRDFLGKGEWVATLKFPRIKPSIILELPDKQQLTQFFKALPNDKAKAIFLLYCSSGLRKSEIINARIVRETRAIMPISHEQYSTKNSFVSFYNAETEQYLMKIGYDLTASEVTIRRMFRYARSKSGVKINPQMLREWFCSEMAMLNVPDRYVDAYCGRVPRSVLAQRYTNFSVQTLKAIYDKANLTVLQQQQPITVMAQQPNISLS